MKILIHAGRHKTGTTYLQQFFGMNAARLLKDFGILYPESGRNPYFNYHHELFENILKNGRKKSGIINELRREVNENKSEIVLLSSEYLSRDTMQSEELKIIKESFSPYDVEIIFYLRRQDDFLCSRYSERVKQNRLAFPDTIWSFNAELNYLKFLDRYARIFGVSNIIVRSYNKAIKIGLIEDFASFLKEPCLAQLPKPEHEANKRLPWRYLHALWYANSNPLSRKILANRGASYFFRRAAKHFPSLFDGNRPITDSEAKLLMQRYADSNNAVAEKYTDGDPLFVYEH
ncbi:hypothetical protein [uncultured Marinobacter sp.]|uniref:hypothetical protein n=1 Tax=uncultured Marinobacter sp. TaxID=187379 RepID=UPI002634A992|nr:hypothetical protein [uncultured Marinobacter sp.]